MSIDVNKATMETFVKFINSGDASLAEQIVAKDASFHVPGQDEPLVGPNAYYISVVKTMRSGFSDIQWELFEMVAEGDTVAARFIARGTHNGTFFGFAPTGIKVAYNAMNFYYFKSIRPSNPMLDEWSGISVV